MLARMINRIRIHFAAFAFLLASGITDSAVAQQRHIVSNWDRSSAMAAARSVNIDIVINEIDDLRVLQALENRSDWPLPAREAAIYKDRKSVV